MDELVIRSIQGRTSSEEEARLRLWRREHPANEERYQMIAGLWERSAPIPTAVSRARPSAQEIIQLAGSRGRADSRAGQRESANRLARWGWIGLAAAGLAALLALPALRGSGTSFGSGELATGVGETATFSLGDGSVIRVGPSSRLRVEATGRVRAISLRGKAFFSVAHDEQRPFVVKTAAGQAMVLGTRFQIDATGGPDMEVLVVEGRVAVSSGDEALEVTGGHLGRVDEGGRLAVLPATSLDERLAWLGTFLSFQDTPLRAAAAEVERTFGVRIEMSDDIQTTRTVTATFREEPVEDVMAVICRVTGAVCDIGDSLVVIHSIP